MDTTTPKFKYFLGCDHAGFELKEIIKQYLISKKIEHEDLGAYTPERCDYPDFAEKVALKVTETNMNRGILVCGSGVGISIAANKFKGVRCGLCHDNYTVRKSLEEEYCNVISLGGRVLGDKLALSIVDFFISYGEFVRDDNFRNKMKEICILEEKYL